MRYKVLTAFLLAMATASIVLAQRGSISGTVVDEQGEPVAGVTVVITAGSDAGQPRTVTTNDDGDFLLAGLSPGRYSVAYEKEGHEKANQEVQIRIGERNRLGDIVLPKLAEDYIAPEAQDYFNEGVAAVDAGDFQKAIESFEKVLDLAPEVPEVHYNLGFAYERVQDMENAAVHYKKALELRPEYYDALVPLAEMHTRRREWTEAAEYWKRAIELRPQDVTAQYNYGAISMNAGDLTTAEAAFEKVLELDPTRALAHYQLGMIAVGQQQNEDAVAHLEKYLELEPEGAQAAAAQGIVDTLTKQP